MTLGSTFQHSPVMIHAAWSGHCREMERNSYGWDEIDWPSTEAMELVAAILSYRGSEDAGVLRVAVEKWSSSNTNPTAMMTRLSWLREVLQDQATVGLRPMYSGSFHELVDYVMACASQAAVQQLETVAHLDQLTGCGNRMAMEVDVQRQLAHASRAHQKLAVAVLDLDGLKEINDGQGHQAGDASLRKLVKVVSEVLRETDSIFRIGGDEFVLLLPLASGEEDVDAMMERALENGAPSFSWGVATYPHDGSNFEQLFEVADRQLYQRRAAVRKIVSMAVAAGVVGGVETGVVGAAGVVGGVGEVETGVVGVVGEVETGVVGAAGVVGGETGGEEVGEETKIVDITVARKWRERAIEWMNERTVAVGTSIAVLVLVVFTVMLLANALGGKQHNTGLNSSAPTPITSIPKRGNSTTTPLQGSSRGSSSGVSGSSTGTSVPFGTGQITSANDSGVPAGNQRAVSGTGSSGAPTTTSSAGSNGAGGTLAGQGNSGTGSGGGSGSGGGTGTGTGTGTGGGGTGTGTGSGSGTGTGTGTGGGLVGGLTHTLSKVPLVGGVVGTLGNVLGTSSASSNQPSGSSTGSSSGNGGSATGSSSSTGSSSPTSTGSGSSGSGSSSGSSGGLLGGLLGSL